MPVSKAPGPCKDGRDRVGAGGLPLLVLPPVPRHCACTSQSTSFHLAGPATNTPARCCIRTAPRSKRSVPNILQYARWLPANDGLNNLRAAGTVRDKELFGCTARHLSTLMGHRGAHHGQPPPP